MDNPCKEMACTTFLFLLTLITAAPASYADSLEGDYNLYDDGHTEEGVIGGMTIYNRRGDDFSVRGEGWQAEGRIEGMQGHYDWRFDDGRAGRTTFSLQPDGDLRGHVLGADLDWYYLAKKKPAGQPQTLTDGRMGYPVSMTVPDGWQIKRDDWYFFAFGPQNNNEVFGLLNAHGEQEEGEPVSSPREVAESNRQFHQGKGNEVSEVTDTYLGNQPAASIVVTENMSGVLEKSLIVYAVKGASTYELSIKAPADQYANYESDMTYIVQNTSI